VIDERRGITTHPDNGLVIPRRSPIDPRGYAAPPDVECVSATPVTGRAVS